MFTKAQLAQHLKKISSFGSGTDNATVLSFHYETNQNYRAQIVCNFDCRYTNKYYDWFTTDWISKFSMFTDTQWKPMRKYPRCNKYNRVYQCNNAELNTCQSSIEFKVAHRQLDSYSINIKINQKPCAEWVSEPQNISSAKVTKSSSNKKEQAHRKPDITRIFYTYFSDGFNPMTAKAFHTLHLLVDKFGTEENFLSDLTINPTMAEVILLYRTWKTLSAENSVNGVRFFKIVYRKTAEMDEMGVIMKTPRQDMVFVITPTMKRVLTYHELNVVIVSSTVIHKGPIATIFFVPNGMGALCFACVFHQHETQDGYESIFTTLKVIIENDCKIILKPECVVTPDSNIVILAIKTVFDKSRIRIAPWSLCRDFWTFICSGKLSVHNEVCQMTMAAFHDIMHAPDAKTAHLRFIKFKNSDEFTTLKKPVKRHFEEVWEKYRLMVWWSSANNGLIELSVTLLQQLVQQKCEGFNKINMCDVMNILDKHFQQLIMRWVSQKSILKTHTKFLKSYKMSEDIGKIKIMLPHKLQIFDEEQQVTVRTDTWCCNCSLGAKASYCEHLCAVMNHTDIAITPTYDERKMLTHIAGEDNITIDYSADNCDVNSMHPPYTNGYYVFHFPNKFNLQHSFEKVVVGSDVIKTEKNLDVKNEIMVKTEDTGDKPTPRVYTQNKLFAELNSGETANREKNLEDLTNIEGHMSHETVNVKAEPMLITEDSGYDVHIIDLDPPTSPKIINQEELFQWNDVLPESEDTIMQNILIKQLNHESDLIIPIKEEKTEEMFLEIDIGNPLDYQNIQGPAIIKPQTDKTTHTQNIDLKNNDLLIEDMSHNFAVTNNNFETEYEKAVYGLSEEFNKLDDYFSSTPNASNLAKIFSLTNELSRAIVEIQDIKSEPEVT